MVDILKMTPKRLDPVEDFAKWAADATSTIKESPDMPGPTTTEVPQIFKPEPQRSGSLDQFGKSAARGVGQIFSGVPWLAGQALRPLPGEIEKPLFDLSTRINKSFAARFPKSEIAAQPLTKWDDDGFEIRPELFADPEWLAGNIPEVAVSLLGSFGLAGLAGKAAKLGKSFKSLSPAAQSSRTRVAQMIGGGIGGGALEGAGKYADLLDEGYSHEEAVNASGLFGVATGVLNSLSVNRFFKPTEKAGLAKYLIDGMVEGGTEFLESPAGAIIDKALLGKEIDWKDVTAAGLNEGILAGLVGGGTAIVAGGRNAREDGKTTSIYGDVLARQKGSAQDVSAEKGRAGLRQDGAEAPGLTQVQGFYSAVEEAVEKIPFRRGSVEQVIGQLKNTAGVKQEELEWLGLADSDGKPLNPFGKGKITKEELATLVRNRGPEVEVRMLVGEEVAREERDANLANYQVEDTETYSSRTGESVDASGFLVVGPEGKADRDELGFVVYETAEEAQQAAQALAQDDSEGGAVRRSIVDAFVSQEMEDRLEPHIEDGKFAAVDRQTGEAFVDVEGNLIETNNENELWIQVARQLRRQVGGSSNAQIWDKLHEERQQALDQSLQQGGQFSGGKAEYDPHVWPDLSIPGGTNYREMLFKSSSAAGFDSGHFSEEDATQEVSFSRTPTEADLRKVLEGNVSNPVRHLIEKVLDGKVSVDQLTTLPAGVVREAFATIPDLVRVKETGIVGHTRFDERTGLDGKQGILVQENQSDLHQKGRKKGYQKPLNVQREMTQEQRQRLAQLRAKEAQDISASDGLTSEQLRRFQGSLTEAEEKELTALVELEEDASTYNYEDRNLPPNAPFKKSWPLFQMKQMIRWAAENGKDFVAWTTGEQQADRYNQLLPISSVKIAKSPEAGTGQRIILNANKDLAGSYSIELDVWKMSQNEDAGKVYRVNAPQLPLPASEFSGLQLSEIVGSKELADKIMAANVGDYIAGEGLRIGGKALKSFYNKEMVNDLNKFLKKYGAKVGRREIPAGPSLEWASGNDVMDRLGIPRAEQSTYWGELSQDERDRLMEEHRNRFGKTTEVWSIEMTPELRRAALGGRIPLFTFLGVKARIANPQELSVAMEAIDAGFDAEKVRAETGWFQGPDGKWRFELSDLDMTLTERGRGLRPELRGNAQIYDLDQVISHPSLFAAYPELRKLQVRYVARTGDTFGYFNPNFNLIEISTQKDSTNAAEMDPQFRRTVMHEVQHWIQGKEGFAQGGSPDTVIDQLIKEGDVAPLFAETTKRLANAVKYRQQLLKTAEPLVGMVATIHAKDSRTRGLQERVLKMFERVGSRQKAVTQLREDVGILEEQLRQLREKNVAQLKTQLEQQGLAYDLYRRLYGEMESTLTEIRLDMSDEARRTMGLRKSLALSEGLDLADALVVMDGEEFFAARPPANIGTVQGETINVDGVARPVRDDVGRPIHYTAKGIENFWKAFGETKAVDSKGRPISLLHGTRRMENRPNRPEVSDEGIEVFAGMSSAGWFAESAKTAEIYAETVQYIRGAQIYPVYVNVTNPLDLAEVFDTNATLTGREVYETAGLQIPEDVDPELRGEVWEFMNSPEFVEAARAAGFDGIRIRENGRLTWNVFDPENIKSAVGNKGKFDVRDPRILESRQKAQTQQEAARMEVEDARKGIARGIGWRNLKRMERTGLVRVLSPRDFFETTGQDPSAVGGFMLGGRIFVNTNSKNPLATILHEGTHSDIGEANAGLRMILGGSYDRLLRQFEGLLAKGDGIAAEAERMAQDARAYAEKARGITDAVLLDNILQEERLAYYVQIGAANPTTFWRRLVNAIAAWFRSTTFGQRLARIGVQWKLTPEMAVELTKLAMAKTTWQTERRLGLGGLTQVQYHGGPNAWEQEEGFPFGRPRLDKIGTGEGAQAYGWGFYSADAEAVATSYWENLSGEKAFISSNKGTFVWYEPTRTMEGEWTYPTGVERSKVLDLALSTVADNGEKAKDVLSRRIAVLEGNAPSEFAAASLEEARAALRLIDEYDLAESYDDLGGGGAVYTLDIPDADLAKYLDWDAPLSEQAESVRQLLEQNLTPEMQQRIAQGVDSFGKVTVKDFYDAILADTIAEGRMALQQERSEWLRSIGIPGLKYLDQGSRDSGFGTRNYVTWDQDVLDRSRVVAINGEQVSSEENPEIDLPLAGPDVGLTSLISGDFYDVGGMPGSQGFAWQDKWNAIVYQVQNKLKYLYNKEKQLELEKGTELPLAQRVHDAETRMHGRIETRMRHFDDGLLKEILNLANQSGREIDTANTVDENGKLTGEVSLDMFLHARHAQEANERLRRINAKKFLWDLRKEVDKDLRRRIVKGFDRIRQAKRAQKLSPFAVSQEYQELLEDMLPYLPQEHQELWEAFARAPSGMLDHLAQDILRREVDNATLQEFGRKFDEMNRESLRVRYESGLMTKLEYETIRDAYEHWAPLQREGFEDRMARRGQGISLSAKEFMVRAGSDRRVVNVLSNAVAGMRASIIRAERQKVGEALVNLVEANPDSEFWGINRENAIPRIDSDGSVSMYHSTQAAHNEVVVKVNGRAIRIWFNPANINAYRIAHGLKNWDTSTNPFLRGLNAINRVLSLVNTTLSPEFLLTNSVRDFSTAQYNMTGTEAETVRKQIVKDLPKAWKGMWRSERRAEGEPALTDWEKWADDFRAHGGATGWIAAYSSIQEVENDLKKRMRQLASGNKAIAGAKAVTDWIVDMNTMAENGIRLSSYKNLVEVFESQGMSAEDARNKAATFAKELTVNFNRKGAQGTLINGLWLFANASIQGSARILMAARHQPKVQKMMGMTILAAIGLAVANRMIGGDDDDGIPLYDKVPDWVKERNLVLMDPNGSGNYVKIPLPWGFNTLFVLGDQLTAAMMKEDFSALDAGGSLMLSILGAFSPVQGGTLLQGIAPTVADPFVMIEENKTFTGAPLKPESNSWRDFPIPEHQLYWKSARKESQIAAKALSDWTGGDDVVGGLFDMSPEVIDLWIDTVTGSAGRFLSDTLGYPVDRMMGEKVDTRKIPFLRRVYGERSTSVTTQMFDERVTRIYQEAERKERKLEGVDRRLVGMKADAKRAERRIAQLRKRIKEATNDDRKEELQNRIEREMLRFNVRFRQRMG